MVNRVKFSSKSIEDFCKDVLDIKYVVDKSGNRINMINERQYLDLRVLYSSNQGFEMGNKSLFNELKDSEANKYLRLTVQGSSHVKSNDLFYDRKSHNLPLYKANRVKSESLEMAIDGNTLATFNPDKLKSAIDMDDVKFEEISLSNNYIGIKPGDDKPSKFYLN